MFTFLTMFLTTSLFNSSVAQAQETVAYRCADSHLKMILTFQDFRPSEQSLGLMAPHQVHVDKIEEANRNFAGSPRVETHETYPILSVLKSERFAAQSLSEISYGQSSWNGKGLAAIAVTALDRENGGFGSQRLQVLEPRPGGGPTHICQRIDSSLF